MIETNPNRRWFTFSLRTLFVLVTIICVWLGFKVEAARRQKEAVEAILKAGGWVLFDYQVLPADKIPPGTAAMIDSDLQLVSAMYDPNALPCGPNWLRNLLGNDCFRNVAEANISLAKAPKDAIDRIAGLPQLKCLILDAVEDDCRIQDEDLVVLGKLNQLERLRLAGNHINGAALAHVCNPGRITHLDLCDTRIDDAGMAQIGKMTNLESLCLDSTRITDAGLAQLHNLTKLRILRLRDTNISDDGLKHFAGLKLMSQLSIDRTHVTEGGVRELQKSLPNCKINGP
jgi:Leucine-rich repeat (LRR) protein